MLSNIILTVSRDFHYYRLLCLTSCDMHFHEAGAALVVGELVVLLHDAPIMCEWFPVFVDLKL